MKLRNLFAVVFVIVAVVLIAAVLSGFQLYGSAVSNSERDSLQTNADARASQLDVLLTERTGEVALLASDPSISVEDSSRETLQRFLDVTTFQGISVIDSDGRMVAIESTDLSEENRSELLGADFSDREYFQNAITGQSYVSDRLEAETGNRIVTLSVPLERNGEIVGTVNAALHLDDGSFFESMDPQVDSDLAIRVSAGTETLYEAGPWDGESMIEASVVEPRTNWTVTVARSEAAIDDGAQTATLLQLAATGVVLMTLVGFGLWFYRSNVRQTERVLDGFERLAAREYGTEIDVGGTDDWTQIGAQFNQLSADLARHERELRQYKRAIEEATDLIYAIDTDGQYLFANPQYCQYHGIDEDEIDHLDALDLAPAAERDQIRTYMDRTMRGAIVKFQSTRRHPVRGERTLDVRYYPLEEAGETTGIVAVLRDVTEREERAQQLRVVDRVLRHNLRNDLTVIGLQAERIKAGSEGAISTAAEEILKRSNDLLVTSNKSRNVTEVLSQEPSVQSIEIASLVREAAADASETHEREITVSAPEEVYANATVYFSRALSELLENAIVHNDSEEPTVEIKLQETAEFVSLRVIDNGPGISRMDVDVLERGRRTEDLYHGSGLGLWMVYWIVTRSGGSVTVRDRTTRGSTIEIRLPTAQPP